MGKINSRSKGARAERQIVKIFQEVIDSVYDQHSHIQNPVIERNLQQFISGGFDLTGLDWLAVEIKHCETFQLKKWWEQCTEQAQRKENSPIPVLIYKKNRVPWRVRMMGANVHRYEHEKGRLSWRPCLMDISIDDFKLWLKDEINHRLV